MGAGHGLLVTRLRLPPFIVTLCGLLLYRGAARYIADDSTKGFGSAAGFEWARALASGSVAGVPMPFVALCVVAGLAWLLLHRSVYGRHLFAIGQNEEAARYSGVRTTTVVVWAYVISGVLAALSGDHHRVLHQLDFTGVTRQLLRALRHCRRRCRRLQPAWRRGLRTRHRHGRGAPPGAA